VFSCKADWLMVAAAVYESLDFDAATFLTTLTCAFASRFLGYMVGAIRLVFMGKEDEASLLVAELSDSLSLLLSLSLDPLSDAL